MRAHRHERVAFVAVGRQGAGGSGGHIGPICAPRLEGFVGSVAVQNSGWLRAPEFPAE
jgi:hypothetical protein